MHLGRELQSAQFGAIVALYAADLGPQPVSIQVDRHEEDGREEWRNMQ